MTFSKLFILAGLYSTFSFAGLLVDEGIEAPENSFPNVVKIAADNSICTGTLIAPDLIITAAHCIPSDPKFPIKISLNKQSGIKVVKSFRSKTYVEYEHHLAQLEKIRDSEEFATYPDVEKSLIAREIKITKEKNTKLDIAFLQLSKKQVMNSAPAIMGCRMSLTPGADVAFAGYGNKYIKGNNTDQNPNHLLHYGSNRIIDHEGVGSFYTVTTNFGNQIPNKGDSGGPLFKKVDQKIVYGVVSAGMSDSSGVGNFAYFTNLSSQSAHGFYQELLNDHSVPPQLKAILKGCL